MRPHEVLGVAEGAPTDVVRAAYKRAALESHPDKGGSKEAFQRVVLAFEHLAGVANDSHALQEKKRKREHQVAKAQAKDAKRKAQPHGKGRGRSDKKPPEVGRQKATGKNSKSNMPAQNFPEELRRLLQTLDAVQRRHVLEKRLTGWQRHALQVWMLERRRTSDSRSSEVCETQRDGVSAGAPLLSLLDKSASVLPEGNPPANAPRTFVGSGKYKPRQGVQRGIVTQHHGRTSSPPTYMAFTHVRHAELRASSRRDLAQAIADNIVLVAMKQKVQAVTSGDLYRERLPKAIVDAAHEHGFDLTRLLIMFRLSVRGIRLRSPVAPWEVALQSGADLVDVLPPNWRRIGVTVEREECRWESFKQTFRAVWAKCKTHTHAFNVERRIERKIEQTEAKFTRIRPKMEKRWLNSMRLTTCRQLYKKRRSWLEIRLSKAAVLIQAWKRKHDQEMAKEAKRKQAKKEMEERKRLAEVRERSAKLMQRLRAERGMT